MSRKLMYYYYLIVSIIISFSSLEAMDLFPKMQIQQKASLPHSVSKKIGLSQEASKFVFKHGQVAIIESIIQNKDTILKELMAQWTDLGADEEDGESELININLQAKSGLMLLSAAILYQKLLVITTVLDDAKLNVDLQDDSKNAAIHHTVMKKDFESLKKLINKRASLELANDSDKTPLLMACGYGYYDFVRELKACGAQINCKDLDGNTPLISLISFNATTPLEIVEQERFILEFLSYKPDLDSQNKNQETALMLSAKYDKISILFYLLTAGAKRNIQDKNGKTAAKYLRRESQSQKPEYYGFIRTILNENMKEEIIDN